MSAPMNASRLRRPLLLLLPTLALALGPGARPALGAEARWRPVGPEGGVITALAVAPSERRVVYAGTREGLVFRSKDQGNHWELAGNGIPSVTVRDLEVDPEDSSVVYAAACRVDVEPQAIVGSLFKTLDGGKSWTAIDTGLTACDVQRLAIDPGHPSTLFAATVNGLFQSDDSGASWRLNGLVPDGGSSTFLSGVAFDPSKPGTLWALDLAHGAFRSTDGGATWVSRNAGLPTRVSVSDVAFDRRHPGTLWLARSSDSGAPVYRSTDDGQSWSPASQGLGGRAVTELELSADSATLYAATSDGVFRSTDGGTTWTAPGPATAGRRVWALAAPPLPRAAVYAGVGQAGVLRSQDRGQSWGSMNRGLTGLQVTDFVIAPSDPAVLYASVPEVGILHSFNGGVAWQPAGQGLTAAPQALAVDPSDARIAYAAGSEGIIWKTTDAGATWTLVTSSETACMFTLQLAIDPVAPRNVYAAGFRIPCPSSVPCMAFKSADAGGSWSCLDDLPSDDLFSLAVAPSSPGTLYTGGVDLFKSVDAGKSWSARAQGLPARSFAQTLVVSPQDARIVYSLVRWKIYKTADGAATWSAAGQGISPDASTSHLAIDPAVPTTLYAVVATWDEQAPPEGRRFDIFQTTDAAVSWAPLTHGGLPADRLGPLRVHPTRTRTLYVLTRAGIYRLLR